MRDSWPGRGSGPVGLRCPVPTPRLTFPRRLRLTHDREYRAVYAGRMKKPAGPLIVHARPNGKSYPRLGLSVGRVVGPAVVRNRVKRLIREAFRGLQHDLPRLPDPLAEGGQSGYDVVVGVRRHELLGLEEYRGLIARAVESAHRDWARRRAKTGDEP